MTNPDHMPFGQTSPINEAARRYTHAAAMTGAAFTNLSRAEREGNAEAIAEAVAEVKRCAAREVEAYKALVAAKNAHE